MTPVLHITRDDSLVCVSISLVGVATFSFRFDAGNEWAAILLQRQLGTMVFETLQAIRRKSYEEGWRQAKQRKSKLTWWSGRFTTED